MDSNLTLKKLVVVLAAWYWPTLGYAQCVGLFPPNTVCGNNAPSAQPPYPVSTPVGLGGVVSMEQFGAKGDCVTPVDDTAALNAAITYLNTNFSGGTIFALNKCYALQQINIGNASVTSLVATPSTINNIHIVGSGAGYTFDLSGGLGAVGTRFMYIGATGANTALLNYNGPITSSDFSYITLDCNGLCSFGSILSSASRGHFSFIGTTNYLGAGIATTTAAATSVSVNQDAQLTTAGNIVEHWYDQQNYPNVAMLKLDGYHNGFFDTALNEFRHIETNLYPGATTGIWEIYADGNTIQDVTFNVYSTESVPVRRTYVNASGTCYPASNLYIGFTVSQGAGTTFGQNVDDPSGCSGISSPFPGPFSTNFFGWLGEQPIQQMPRDPTTRHEWYFFQDQGSTPFFGGVWGLGGGNLYELGAFRNLLVNAQFTECVLCTGSPPAVSGSVVSGVTPTLDNWFINTNDTAGTFSVTQNTAAPGDGTRPYNLRNYATLTTTSIGGGGGAAYFTFSQAMPGVRTLQNMYATCAVWMWTNSGTVSLTASPTLTQVFGDGSPTAPVNVDVVIFTPGVNITTSPQKFEAAFQVPSVTGATINANDATWFNIFFPPGETNTVNMLAPQCQTGSNSNAFDLRNPLIDTLLNGHPSGSGVVLRQTNPVIAGANFSGQLYSTNGTPTITSGSCGTGANGTVAGTYQSGEVTIGSATTTSCEVTFSPALPQNPGACIITAVNAAAAAAAARVSAWSATGLIINAAALASTTFNYVCL